LWSILLDSLFPFLYIQPIHKRLLIHHIHSLSFVSTEIGIMEEQHFGPVWFIPGQNQGKYPFCHSLYIEGAGILIDPASDREALIRLRENQEVKMVWLSHWHEDHFMHLDLFDDLPLWISDRDAPPLSDIELFLDWYGIDKGDYREYWKVVLNGRFRFRPRRPTGYIKAGQTIDLGVTEVEIISTPGHTPGHLAFFFREPKVLFIGDYDLTKFGPWYGDVHSSIEETIDSVNLLRRIPARIILASHGAAVFTGDSGKLWDDYLEVINERERKLLELLKEPRTMKEIVGSWIIYGREREPKAFFEVGERSLMGKHLDRLIKLGAVVQKKDRYVKADC
jgi:hydroxyacylglutathione hydrolase